MKWKDLIPCTPVWISLIKVLNACQLRYSQSHWIWWIVGQHAQGTTNTHLGQYDNAIKFCGRMGMFVASSCVTNTGWRFERRCFSLKKKKILSQDIMHIKPFIEIKGSDELREVSWGLLKMAILSDQWKLPNVCLLSNNILSSCLTWCVVFRFCSCFLLTCNLCNAAVGKSCYLI